MTAEQLARRMLARRDLVEQEMRKTAGGLGLSAVKFTKELMTREIYAVPEDISPRTGRKKWRRTGQLRRAERFELRDSYSVAVLNDQVYAEPRHEAGKPGRRGINPLRESHWRDELAKTFRSICVDAWHATVLDLLRRGKI
jgi:hypothetical protein